MNWITWLNVSSSQYIPYYSMFFLVQTCISIHFQLPPSVSISFDCRDLLLRLLQRNPKDRISFEDFFGHPFIDLEHVPSPKCLQKAVSQIFNLFSDQPSQFPARFICRLETPSCSFDWENSIIWKSSVARSTVSHGITLDDSKLGLFAFK